jgi:hypothetical protein
MRAMTAIMMVTVTWSCEGSPPPAPAPAPGPAPARDPITRTSTSTVTCSPAIADALRKLPPATWSFDAGAPPADRAALEQAVAVEYTPVPGDVQPFVGSWFVDRKLATPVACDAPRPPDVIAARVVACDGIDSGRGYRDPDGNVTAVDGARCRGALVWVRSSTGEVLGKVVGTSIGSPGATPDRASDGEVRRLSSRAMEVASITMNAELAKAVADWSADDRAIHERILAEERARRLQGVQIDQRCLDNPLASGCM